MNRKSHKIILFYLLTICFVFTLCAVYIHFGNTKIGYDGDEVFSYMSSNSEKNYKEITALCDNSWYPSEYFHDALSVTEGHQFHYDIPVRNQATDVHPPFYYILLHTICSFFPGQFSMWYGITLNIILTLLSLIALFYLLRFILGGSFLPLTICFIFGLTYGVINNVLFIRMYVLLMLLVTLQYYYHLRIFTVIKSSTDKFTLKQLLLLSLITITGTLSQYYFLIFLFWLAAVFCMVLFIQKKWAALFQYISTMLFSGICSIALYPTMIRHIFSGYRGEEAAHKLVSIQGAFGDIQDMFSLMSRQLANRHLGSFLLAMLAWALLLILFKKIPLIYLFYSLILAAPAALYFLTVTKISPFVVDRYITPVYGIVYGLITAGLAFLTKASLINVRITAVKYFVSAAVLCVGVFISIHHISGNVEQSRYWFAERNQAIRDYTAVNDSCIYISADEYHWKIWSEFPSFLEYEKIYYIDGLQWNPIVDKTLSFSDEILVYIEDGVDVEKARSYILNELGYRTWELLFESAYAAGYVISQKTF